MLTDLMCSQLKVWCQRQICKATTAGRGVCLRWNGAAVVGAESRKLANLFAKYGAEKCGYLLLLPTQISAYAGFFFLEAQKPFVAQ